MRTYRIKKNSIIFLLSMFPVMANFAMANDASSTPETSSSISIRPERVIRLGGHEAVVQDVILGPSATSFWRKLQTLIRHREFLENFAKLSQNFSLESVGPPDSLGSQPIGNAALSVAKDRFRIMQNITFKVTQNVQNGSATAYQFEFALNPIEICLSPSELRRSTGRGLVFAMNQMYSGIEVQADPSGTPFGEAYITQLDHIESETLILEYSPSGCLAHVKFTHLKYN
jgi:hypothetical protein